MQPHPVCLREEQTAQLEGIRCTRLVLTDETCTIGIEPVFGTLSSYCCLHSNYSIDDAIPRDELDHSLRTAKWRS